MHSKIEFGFATSPCVNVMPRFLKNVTRKLVPAFAITQSPIPKHIQITAVPNFSGFVGTIGVLYFFLLISATRPKGNPTERIDINKIFTA